MNERKATANWRNHGVLFTTAVDALDDPFEDSTLDPESDEERWRTIAQIDGVLLYIVHTEPDLVSGTPAESSARAARHGPRGDCMNTDRRSPEVEANLRELRALGDAGIDLSEMPEVTDWPNPERGRWHRLARAEKAVPLDPDLADWFARHGEAGEDLRARVNRALSEHVARVDRAAA